MEQPPIRICTEKELSHDQTTQLRAFEIAKAQNPRNIPESNIINPFHLALVRGKMHKVGALLKIKFLNGTEKQKLGVKTIAKEWEHHANVKFNFVASNKPADIRIAFKWKGDEGSWSYIGTDCFNIPQNEPTMNFGWLNEDGSNKEEYSRTVLHELCHALGAIHEHQSPAAGEIPWDTQKVYNYYMGPPNNWSKEQIDTNIFQKYSTTRTQYSKFDKESIMLYSIPNSLTIGDYEIKANNKLSETDKEYMGTIYPFTIKQITQLPLGKTAITTIGKYMEEDYYEFTVPDKPTKAILYTEGDMDSVMSLMEADTKKVIAWDDDTGMFTNARIEKLLNKGKYLVRIRHYSPTATGKYKLITKAEYP